MALLFRGFKRIPKSHKIYIAIRLEFDPKKNLSNKTKHGIDSHEAQGLWNERELPEIPAEDSR